MKSVLLAFALLFPSAALAVEAVEVNARDHSCKELAQIIRKDKAVFVIRRPDAIWVTSTTLQR